MTEFVRYLASAVAGTDHIDELGAVGAAMDRRRAVEYALERLDVVPTA